MLGGNGAEQREQRSKTEIDHAGLTCPCIEALGCRYRVAGGYAPNTPRSSPASTQACC